MKGFISIDIPTKSYIKAYIISQLGEKPVMNTDHIFGNKLYDILEHSTNERKKEFSNERYNAVLRVFISRHTFYKRGCNLNETNIKNFNIFIEKKIKHRFSELMDDAIEILPVFEANLMEIRRKLGIDIEAWGDDSMKKDYYRYRKNKNLPLLYNKITARTVPSEHPSGLPF